MTAEQYLGHVPAVEHLGTRIDRSLDESVLKGVAQGTLLVADGSGQESHYRIGNDRRREFTAGEHIVADGDFLGDEVLADSIVHALVVAA